MMDNGIVMAENRCQRARNDYMGCAGGDTNASVVRRAREMTSRDVAVPSAPHRMPGMT